VYEFVATVVGIRNHGLIAERKHEFFTSIYVTECGLFWRCDYLLSVSETSIEIQVSGVVMNNNSKGHKQYHYSAFVPNFDLILIVLKHRKHQCIPQSCIKIC
jgi:hypothetical protein